MSSKDKLSKPYASSLAINREWSKVSKTLDKSKNKAPILFPIFRLLFQFSIIISNACFVLWFLRNPVKYLENSSLIYVLI